MSQNSGWRYRKTIKILPGVRLCLSKSGAALSIGAKGLTYRIPFLYRKKKKKGEETPEEEDEVGAEAERDKP